MRNSTNAADTLEFSPVKYWAIRLHTNRRYLNQITTDEYIRKSLEANEICSEATYQREISPAPRSNDHWHIALTTFSYDFLSDDDIKKIFNISHKSEYCLTSHTPDGYLKYCAKHATRKEGPYHWSRRAYLNALTAKPRERPVLSYFKMT